MPTKRTYILLVICFLVTSYLILPRYGFTYPSPVCCDAIATHLLYPISHANIWHLACNCVCLLAMRCPLHLPATYIIAVMASFLPSFTISVQQGFALLSEPTMGFSGVLFAIGGMAWGRTGRFWRMLKYNLPIILITAFIPHVNAFIHLYSMLLAYAYARLKTIEIPQYRNPPIPKSRNTAKP